MKKFMFIWKVWLLWCKHPDWRFCQLVVNVADCSSNDPFYVEDDEFSEKLSRL